LINRLFNGILFHSSIELDDCGCSDDKLLRLTHSQTSPTIQLKLKKTANTLARSLARVVASVTLTRLFLPPLETKSNKFDLEKISPLSLATNRSYNPGSSLARSCVQSLRLQYQSEQDV
jgi:hypothetical protein